MVILPLPPKILPSQYVVNSEPDGRFRPKLSGRLLQVPEQPDGPETNSQELFRACQATVLPTALSTITVRWAFGGRRLALA